MPTSLQGHERIRRRFSGNRIFPPGRCGHRPLRNFIKITQFCKITRFCKTTQFRKPIRNHPQRPPLGGFCFERVSYGNHKTNTARAGPCAHAAPCRHHHGRQRPLGAEARTSPYGGAQGGRRDLPPHCDLLQKFRVRVSHRLRVFDRKLEALGRRGLYHHAPF